MNPTFTPTPTPTPAQAEPVSPAPEVTEAADVTEVAEAAQNAADEAPTEAGQGNEEGAASASRGGTRSTVTRSQVRRILAKAQELEKAEPRVRTLAAGILGCADTVLDLTSLVMTADTRALLQVTSDLESARTLPEMEAGLTVAMLPKARFRALWSLVDATGVGLGKIPASDMKAALELTNAARNLDEIAVGEIESATVLLRKG